MAKIAVVYGSSTDNTKNAAEIIAKELSGKDVTLLDVGNLKAEDLDSYQSLILGTSTWGLGDLQDDWDSYLSNLEKSNLEGKTIALFGLGDSSSYSDTYVDGMGILYDAIKNKGIKLVGEVPTDSYSFDDSKAVVDGKFVGLALDEENEGEKTEERIEAWVKEIEPLI